MSVGASPEAARCRKDADFFHVAGEAGYAGNVGVEFRHNGNVLSGHEDEDDVKIVDVLLVVGVWVCGLVCGYLLQVDQIYGTSCIETGCRLFP